MNPERLLQYFDRISEAPDAIPCLRRFILDLAVRGKLVEQDPNDEPAAELLKRIQAEKAPQGRSFNSEESKSEMFESPFAIPTGWVWVTATEPARIVSDNGKKIQTKDVLESGSFPVVDQGKVFIRGYCNDPDKVIKVSKPVVVFGDHTRETKLIDFDFVVGADGVKLLEPIEIDPAYYFLALQWVPLDSRGYGRHFKLLRESLIPLPPLAEQHRVVAKVDELMALCDQLEAAKTEREQSRDRLVAASLHYLNQPADAEEANTSEAFRDHARFYFNNLPRLTTRPEHIKQLRQTILNLAVRGKLVPQDPNDEPAAELLKRIQTEKEKLAQRRNRAEEDSQVTEETCVSFEIPDGWCWVRLDEIAMNFRYGTSVKCSYEQIGEPVLRIPNVDNGRINITDLKFGSLSQREIDDLKLHAGDILMVRSNGSLDLVGRPALVEAHVFGFCYAGYLVRVRTNINYIAPEYVVLALITSHVRDQIEIPIRTTVGLKNVNATELSRLSFPLPPLAEQHRIVAKVDELMALCDQLETQLTTTEADSRRLLEAVLHEALTSDLEEAA